MKKKLRVCHVASFGGNVGDNANHNGTYQLLRRNLEADLTFTQVEIREFYYKQKSFDQSFVSLVNNHDLCLIGGGNYFELWVEDSCTGTSIDLSIELLNKITTPLVFYALGVDAGQGVTDSRLRRFQSFLDSVFANEHMLVSVRNDGASATIEKYLGKPYLERISLAPDGGFFTSVQDTTHPEILPHRQVIAINLAGDMPDTRFPGATSKCHDLSSFISEFAEVCTELLESQPDIDLLLIPHIYRDIGVYSLLFDHLPDSLRRFRMTMAPYLHGAGSEKYIFDLYKKSTLSLGMRFHANVCPIGLGTPSLGLTCYPQIAHLYRELGCPERAISVQKPHFKNGLLESINTSLERRDEIQRQYSAIRVDLEQRLSSFHRKIRDLL